jgi:uncharacterized protein (TIGR03067 family)
MIRCVGHTLVLASLLSGRAGADEKSELKKMEGTWLPTAVQLSGQNWSDEQVKTLKLVIADGKFTVTVSGQDDKGNLKLDPNAKPAAMDIVGTDGPNKGRTIPAIYELSGDTLKICYGLGVETRPTQFESKPGTRILLITYKREKR